MRFLQVSESESDFRREIHDRELGKSDYLSSALLFLSRQLVSLASQLLLDV